MALQTFHLDTWRVSPETTRRLMAIPELPLGLSSAVDMLANVAICLSVCIVICLSILTSHLFIYTFVCWRQYHVFGLCGPMTFVNLNEGFFGSEAWVVGD